MDRGPPIFRQTRGTSSARPMRFPPATPMQKSAERWLTARLSLPLLDTNACVVMGSSPSTDKAGVRDPRRWFLESSSSAIWSSAPTFQPSIIRRLLVGALLIWSTTCSTWSISIEPFDQRRHCLPYTGPRSPHFSANARSSRTRVSKSFREISSPVSRRYLANTQSVQMCTFCSRSSRILVWPERIHSISLTAVCQ